MSIEDTIGIMQYILYGHVADMETFVAKVFTRQRHYITNHYVDIHSLILSQIPVEICCSNAIFVVGRCPLRQVSANAGVR